MPGKKKNLRLWGEGRRGEGGGSQRKNAHSRSPTGFQWDPVIKSEYRRRGESVAELPFVWPRSCSWAPRVWEELQGPTRRTGTPISRLHWPLRLEARSNNRVSIYFSLERKQRRRREDIGVSQWHSSSPPVRWERRRGAERAKAAAIRNGSTVKASATRCPARYQVIWAAPPPAKVHCVSPRAAWNQSTGTRLQIEGGGGYGVCGASLWMLHAASWTRLKVSDKILDFASKALQPFQVILNWPSVHCYMHVTNRSVLWQASLLEAVLHLHLFCCFTWCRYHFGLFSNTTRELSLAENVMLTWGHWLNSDVYKQSLQLWSSIFNSLIWKNV